MIWFLEGQSSQREVIMGAREALPASVRIIASHRQDRSEITGQADVALQEPRNNAERIDWVLETARELGVKVIIAGRVGSFYEAHRERFVAEGFDLVTGGTSMQTFINVDDKSLFTAAAEQAGLACIPGISASNTEELQAAYETLSRTGEVCIKPTVGIFGHGFWRFKAGVDDFRCFANPDARETSFEAYLNAYRQSDDRPPMLLMPYMPGSECSVDMVCEHGKAVAFVGRRKQGMNQTFERDSEAVQLAVQAAEHFGCDGLINVQTRDDADGKPHLLEINPRYSGGIGYTREAGINLPGIFATRRLGLKEPETHWLDNIRVKAITVAVLATV
ncbi:ATP-grasp domain-containing protein [Pseudomonas lijiangensis]|uniref:ATP-grasp domain-containing protein n=1 Tax=Pseudomonas lijiangensis TaxID=2995658 RepID=A0ABX8HP48_9PSED|nr:MULTISPECIES: ATP-grasp domain-containing protein [Pseudomonas syringae group]MBX8489537.1 ATP-grasp domain-containing protein [Pseudomonas cichorii]MBX8500283.1 ATP-grasp domain-containing protein [Pseudomonas lijiangensis]MBX8505535.1 ATP-grasp domain-containing protein [Pseudomonas lijiangensis]QWU82389.1 ATP-grasp domain-containing protein [Pseudomonas lijiangensis]